MFLLASETLSRIYLVLNCEKLLIIIICEQGASESAAETPAAAAPEADKQVVEHKILKRVLSLKPFFRMKPWLSPADPHRFSGYLSSLTFDHLGTLECHKAVVITNLWLLRSRNSKASVSDFEHPHSHYEGKF